MLQQIMIIILLKFFFCVVKRSFLNWENGWNFSARYFFSSNCFLLLFLIWFFHSFVVFVNIKSNYSQMIHLHFQKKGHVVFITKIKKKKKTRNNNFHSQKRNFLPFLFFFFPFQKKILRLHWLSSSCVCCFQSI